MKPGCICVTINQARLPSLMPNYERNKMKDEISIRLLAMQIWFKDISNLARTDKAKAAQELLKSEKSLDTTINEVRTLLNQLPINEAASISTFRT